MKGEVRHTSLSGPPLSRGLKRGDGGAPGRVDLKSKELGMYEGLREGW